MGVSRRRFVTTLGVAVCFSIAGCSTRWIGGQTGESTTEQIPTPQDCPEESRVVDSGRDDIPPVPDPPESLDNEMVLLEYVEQYEKAYQWQQWKGYGEEIHEFFVEMGPEVDRTSDTAVIVKSDSSQVSGTVDHNGDGTAGHFDGATYAVHYLITTDGVWRTAADYESIRTVPDLDPRKNGDLLECYRGAV